MQMVMSIPLELWGANATMDFDAGPGIFNMTNSDLLKTEIYISKLDSSGDFVWAQKVKGSSTQDFRLKMN